MIDRYTLPEMAELFTDEARLSLWLEIELLAIEGWAGLGVIEPRVAAAARVRAPAVDAAFVAAVAERERVTDHDVAAFVDVVSRAIGPPEGAWVHYGLTSSDVVDTALSVTLCRAGDLLVGAADGLVDVLRRRADRVRLSTGRRAHPRHARRADDVRGEAGPFLSAGRSRPRPTGTGP